ncbi:MAG: folate-binding protein [Rickettsiaceae bacterium]|nr:folate-binding protein [Rickettsiaceae bacterium]
MFEILSDRSIIHIVGLDSQKFLQSLTTNDVVNKIYTYNYLLNNQGRYLYDFYIYQDNDKSYFLDIDKASSTSLIKRLSMYKLRSHIEIHDASEFYTVLYSRSKIQNSLFSLRDPRYNKLGFRSIIKTVNINKLEAKNSNLYLEDKYKFAIVDGTPDLVVEKSIPIEFGAEELNAIDYKKGCYVGQEVISRAKYQGVVRKKIFKLQSDVNFLAIEPGAELTFEGVKVGKLCSFYENLAIGLLWEEKYLGLTEKKVMINSYILDVTVPSWR